MYAYTQILFGQLMALALNQASFGVRREDAAALVTGLARAAGLPQPMLEGVLAVLG